MGMLAPNTMENLVPQLDYEREAFRRSNVTRTYFHMSARESAWHTIPCHFTAGYDVHAVLITSGCGLEECGEVSEGERGITRIVQ